MSTRKNKAIKLKQSNRIVTESLQEVSESIFEDVYKQADRTLAKILRNQETADETAADEQCLNVIAFLGGRGRGKTSAMCSFHAYLTKLHEANDWSEISQKEKIRFLTFPYIDAAMLAESEYIIDVILAQMWDKFEEQVQKDCRAHEADYERLTRNVEQQFIKVRTAYMTIKQWEKKQEQEEIEIPVPSALHELAVSVNLRKELQRLIGDYLKIFRYDRRDDIYNYMVFAIDDVDMSAQKAHFILEQIRRFLSMKQVIILITADIDRLQLACESRYIDVYVEGTDRNKFINEYLEKVLPYNMRIYMPEIKERHDPIQVETQEELGLLCNDEKKMILESMAEKCGIYFDGLRRKRHFLQNQSMRSMVNYFEQMIRMKDDYITWLKIDLRERITERITNLDQKNFMKQLLSKDYEDVNNYVLTYLILMRNNRVYVLPDELDTYDKSIGQVLYMCQSFEDYDADNTEFVDAVIMLYSIIMKTADEELRNRVIGGSLWGAREYGLISADAGDSSNILAFDNAAKLELLLDNYSVSMLRQNDPCNIFKDLIEKNHVVIMAWLYTLLFVGIDMQEEIDCRIKEEQQKKPNFARLIVGVGKNIEAIQKQASMPYDDSEEKKDWKISVYPRVIAQKRYLTNAFLNNEQIYKQIEKMLEEVLKRLAKWIQEKNEKQTRIAVAVIQSQRERLLGFFRQGLRIIRKSEQMTGKDSKTELQKGNTHKFADSVEILYSISRTLSNRVIPNEFDPKEAYKMLVSSYSIIRNELKKRDEEYHEMLHEKDWPEFEKMFMHSPQAQILLNPQLLSADVRADFEDKMGNLLLEYRGKVTTLQRTNQSSSDSI